MTATSEIKFRDTYNTENQNDFSNKSHAWDLIGWMTCMYLLS